VASSSFADGHYKDYGSEKEVAGVRFEASNQYPNSVNCKALLI
jgi:hypothetical protein